MLYCTVLLMLSIRFILCEFAVIGLEKLSNYLYGCLDLLTDL